MDDWSVVETLTAVFLGLAVLAGAAYGALAVGAVPAVVGGGAMFGVFALVLVVVLAAVATAFSRLFARGRNGKR